MIKERKPLLVLISRQEVETHIDGGTDFDKTPEAGPALLFLPRFPSRSLFSTVILYVPWGEGPERTLPLPLPDLVPHFVP